MNVIATKAQSPKQQVSAYQAVAGLTLAATLITVWLALHISSVYFTDLATAPWWEILPRIAVLCWLYVGLFIIAHDCMHGSLYPGKPGVNTAIGRLSVALYACFSLDQLRHNHMLHHKHAGTDGDPDFGKPGSVHFLRWYGQFMMEYLTLRQMILMGAAMTVFYLALNAPIGNLATFVAVPALLSSLQLFYFGTWLPHHPDADAFTDRHNARSNDYPVWLSLLTCFHFGYHHEHHSHPGVPWWRLPAERRRELSETKAARF
jgi:beta-carotene/zeaxanthin 4-ketolase